MAINTTSVKEMFGSAAVTEALMSDRPFVLYGLPMIPGLSTENYKRACELYDMIIYDDSIEEAEPLYLEYLKMCAEDKVNFARAAACLARTVKASVSGAHLPDVYNWLNCMLLGDLGATEAEMDLAQEKAKKANEGEWTRQEDRAAAHEAELQKLHEKEEKSLKNRVKNMKQKIKKNKKSEEDDGIILTPVEEEEPIAEEPVATEETTAAETPVEEVATTETPVEESETPELDKANAKIEEEQKKAKADEKPADKSTTNKTDTEVNDNEKKAESAGESKEDSVPVADASESSDARPEETPVPVPEDPRDDGGLNIEQFNVNNFIREEPKIAKKETGAFDINKFVKDAPAPAPSPMPNPQTNVNVQPTQSAGMAQPVDYIQAGGVRTNVVPAPQQTVGINPMLLAYMMQRHNNPAGAVNPVQPPYAINPQQQGYAPAMPNMNGGQYAMPQMIQQPPVDIQQVIAAAQQSPVTIQQAVAEAQQTLQNNVCSCGDPNCTGKHDLNPVNEEEAKKHTTDEIPDPAPKLTKDEKTKYVKNHIEFIDGAHTGENGVSITQLNSLYSMITSNELKKHMKKFKTKVRASAPYLYEVSMDKYAEPGDSDLYDIVFEAPCENVNGHRAKMVVKFQMEPQWNDVTKCYGNNLAIYRVESNRGADTPSKDNTKKKGAIDVKESDDKQDIIDEPVMIVKSGNNKQQKNNKKK